MDSLIGNITIFMCGELVALLVFWLIIKIFKRSWSLSAVLRGVLERGFLFIILIINLPQGLAFFGALKIATRLKNDDQISNEYFLVGNLISVLIVIGYYLTSQYYF
jgi:hypothetical protein